MNHIGRVDKKDVENFMPENQQKKRDAPEFMRKQPKSGAFWVLERMETVGDGCERMGKPGVRTKMHQMTMQHVQKENRRNPSVFAGFLAGAEGLGLGCRLGRFAAERHWRSLTPRHALRRGAAVPRCRVLMRANEKREASRCLSLFFGRGRRT